MVGEPARDFSACLGIQSVFPQITQIDADVSLFVGLRYLRHLRAILGGWVEIRNPKSEISAGVGGRNDTIKPVTIEQTSRLRTFIRSTLGCGCPDDVLDWIQCTHTELTQEDDTRITRIDVGGRLLVYILEIEGPDWRAEETLPAVVAAATVDRATSCFNRLRVVVAMNDPEEMRPRMERVFNGSAPADDKVHLHVVRSTELPFD